MRVARQCLVCSAPFTVQPSVIQKGFGLYCSRVCKVEAQKTSIVRNCLLCAQPFTVFLSKIADGHGLYCSHVCAGIGRGQERKLKHPVEERFWRYVMQPSCLGKSCGCQKGLNCCWPWMGGRRNDYGCFSIDGKAIPAHRFAYELVHGPQPPSVKILHQCDNPPCCREEHLFTGTQQDNVTDMIVKGRANKARGEYAGRAKLTPEDVQEIRQAEGKIPGIVLARRFNVSSTSIYYIFQRKSWKHIP